MRLWSKNIQPNHGFGGPSETVPKPSGFARTETIRNHAETGMKPHRNQTETIDLPRTETTETIPYRNGFGFGRPKRLACDSLGNHQEHNRARRNRVNRKGARQ